MGVLSFESVDEILKCHHSNENYCGKYFCDGFFSTLYKEVLILESEDNKIL